MRRAVAARRLVAAAPQRRASAGEPSIAQYVRIDDTTRRSMLCLPDTGLAPLETSCSVTPVAGVCPMGAVVTAPAPLPIVPGVTGSIEGFEILVHPEVVEDPEAPRPEELRAIMGRCADACTSYFASRPGQSANCHAPDAFVTPQVHRTDVQPALDLVSGPARTGAGIFTGQSLSCDLGLDCTSRFDEGLGAATPARSTPADTPLGLGEEYRVPIGGDSELKVSTSWGSQTTALTGTAGYSFCAGGSQSEPCPFYLGSFEAEATSTITPKITCADSSVQELAVSGITLRLAQPAFGIAAKGASTSKGFPAGGLVIDAEFTVGSTPQHTMTRAMRTRSVVSASGGQFSVGPIEIGATVPCNGSTAEITLVLAVESTGGAPLDRPPSVSITTPANVSCTRTTSLAATATDPDGDLVGVRWFIDDVLMAPAVTSVVFGGAHTLRAVARDARGAATTAVKKVSCL